ncbi:MAG: class I SAM-dependent methyltransferase [Thermodesulfobacteriota bacterium]
MGEYDKWVETYKAGSCGDYPWDVGHAREVLVALVESGRVSGPVLDLCSGAGTNTIYLAKEGFDLTAMDIAPGAIELLTDRAAAEGCVIKTVRGSIVELPFEDGAFNFVHDFGCFHHVIDEDRDRFLIGLKRVLKSGGLYQLTCFSRKNGPDWNHFTEADIRGRFEDGFKVLEHRHYGCEEGDRKERFFHTFLMERK